VYSVVSASGKFAKFAKRSLSPSSFILQKGKKQVNKLLHALTEPSSKNIKK